MMARKVSPIASYNTSAPVARMLQRYLTIGNYFLVVPFKTELDVVSGNYKCTQSPLMLRVIMGLVQAVAVLLLLLLDIQILEVSVQPSSAVLVFRHITYFLFAMHILFSGFNYFIHERRFEFVLNSVKELESMFTQAGISVSKVSKLPLMLRSCVAFLIISPVFESLLCFGQLQRGVYKGFQSHLQTAYHIIHGYMNCTEIVPNPEVKGHCVVTWDVAAVAVVISLATLFSFVVFNYSNICCLLHAILLLYFADAVMNHMKNDRIPGSRLRSIQICNHLLDLSNKVGEALGVSVTTFCFALLPYLSFRIISIITRRWFNNSWLAFPRNMVHLMGYILVIGSAAKSNARMSRFAGLEAGRRCRTEGSEVSVESENVKEELVLLLHRISANEYGLHGCGFTITYSFMGNVAGLVLTYAIIIFQLGGH